MEQEGPAEIRVIFVRHDCSHGAAAGEYDGDGLLGVVHAK